MNYLSYHIVFIIAAQAITITHMLYRRRNHSAILAWMMAILTLPYFAMAFYLLFGHRKIGPSRSQKRLILDHGRPPVPSDALNPIETLLAGYPVAPTANGNDVRLIFDGRDACRILLDEIEAARTSVWIAVYILEEDDVTRPILDALERKAREGVEVKLLIDALGSFKLYFRQGAVRRLRAAGCDVVFFAPLLANPLTTSLNLRNHRKIYLFDGRTVLGGGMNLAREYLGPGADRHRWIDLMFRIEGEAARVYAEIFIADFVFAGGKKGPLCAVQPLPELRHPVQTLPSGPDIAGDILYETLLGAIYTARQRIWIVTPYFVPDESLLRALVVARHRGVDIRLVTPRSSNHLIADLGRSSYMRELQEHGIDVLLHTGAMLHTKLVLFDDYAVMLGSVNLDNRSLFLNYETVSFVYEASVINRARQWMSDLMHGCGRTMTRAGKGRTVMENLMRIFAPQL